MEMSHRQILCPSNGIVAIDPGPEKTGVLSISKFENVGGVIFPRVDYNVHIPNIDVTALNSDFSPNVVIEMPEPRGMPVGKDVFDTIYWAGRFTQHFKSIHCDVYHMNPRGIKIAICGVAKAKDPSIREAILDILDPNRVYGKYGRGKKGANGPLYGIVDHSFACMRMAIAYMLLKEEKKHEK